TKDEWIRLSSEQGTIQFDERVYVDIDWGKAPSGQQEGEIVMSGAGQEFAVKVPIRNSGLEAHEFVEDNGVVSIDAPNFTRKFDSKDIAWTTVPNMGRTGSSVTVDPPDAERQTPGKQTPRLEYEFT